MCSTRYGIVKKLRALKIDNDVVDDAIPSDRLIGPTDIGTGGVIWPGEDDDSDKVVFSRINKSANTANSQLHYTIIIIIIMRA